MKSGVAESPRESSTCWGFPGESAAINSPSSSGFMYYKDIKCPRTPIAS